MTPAKAGATGGPPRAAQHAAMPEPAEQPLRYLTGVGPARAQALADAGLHSVFDLLHRVPRFVGAAPDEHQEGPLPRGAPVQVRARIVSAHLQQWARRSTLDVRMEGVGRKLRARFFNAPWLRERFIAGEWFLFEGRTDRKQADTLNHPRFVHLGMGDADATAARSGCDVAYPLPAGYGDHSFRELIARCREQFLAELRDPAGLLDDAHYQARIAALHEPASAEDFEAARRVLAARELLALAWLLQTRRAQMVQAAGRAWRWDRQIHGRALARLPFALTAGQEHALAEIRADMQSTQPMYRLLQGDVGSGKTALALLAALAAVADGAQVLFLAPTAVLARQHFAFCEHCLAGSRVRIGLLTGGTPQSERAPLLHSLAAGGVDILIGTHALLEDPVRTHELGLVIIDEQHKFGVAQRARLVGKAGRHDYQPDLLLLTATPIPRTLALTAFGDLAVSRIGGRLPGREPVATRMAALALPTLTDAIDTAVAAGGRAYVVTPLRQESEKVEAADAGRVTAALEDRYGAAQVRQLHGAMKEDEKLAALQAFRVGEARILVSTTVIEVGVDVPEANLMAVCDAERFGLAQLHQLRGRIGRGALGGECLLLYRRAENAERLRVLCESDDGLAIAESDLVERGPGELLGTRQHGLPVLRAADLSRDLDLLQDAHEHVRQRVSAGETMPTGLRRFLPEEARAELLRGG